MILNMGPQHPSTHGVLRVLLEIDGETIVRIMPDIGFLHTRCELIRVNSFNSTRNHCAFGGISSPSSFSTAST